MTVDEEPLPRIPASAGALIWDRKGRLLILKPTYKDGWTIPGGVMQADGETPWEACRREAREECSLDLEHGRLVVVDFLRPRPDRAGGMRFLFDCGVFDDETLADLALQAEEISEYRLAPLDQALTLLSGPLRRRVKAATKKRGTKKRGTKKRGTKKRGTKKRGTKKRGTKKRGTKKRATKQKPDRLRYIEDGRPIHRRG